MKVTIIPVGSLGTNCYLLETQDKHCAIIDPGAQPDKIKDVIEEGGLTPSMILLTHGHHDHIGGVNKLQEAYPSIPVYVGEKDQIMLSDTDKSLAIYRHQNQSDYIVTTAQSLTEGDELSLEELTIRVLHTPGHTQGGLSYLCEDALFTGDTLFYRSCGRCDLYGGDYEEILRSLKRLAQLEGNYTVYPGHGQSTFLEEERRYNRYMGEACS